jgi:hypothetical protein
MYGPMFWGSIADSGDTLKWLTSVIGDYRVKVSLALIIFKDPNVPILYASEGFHAIGYLKALSLKLLSYIIGL